MGFVFGMEMRDAIWWAEESIRKWKGHGKNVNLEGIRCVTTVVINSISKNRMQNDY